MPLYIGDEERAAQDQDVPVLLPSEEEIQQAAEEVTAEFLEWDEEEEISVQVVAARMWLRAIKKGDEICQSL